MDHSHHHLHNIQRSYLPAPVPEQTVQRDDQMASGLAEDLTAFAATVQEHVLEGRNDNAQQVLADIIYGAQALRTGLATHLGAPMHRSGIEVFVADDTKENDDENDDDDDDEEV